MQSAQVGSSSQTRIEFPTPGVIRIVSEALFSEPDEQKCQDFLARAFRAPEIQGAVIAPSPSPAVDLCFDAKRHSGKTLLQRIAGAMAGRERPKQDVLVAPAKAARDHKGVVRYQRLHGRVTGWRVERERLGFVTLANPTLFRKSTLCQAVERELMSVLGVYRYDTHALKAKVDIEYDPRQISLAQLTEILDEALANAEHQAHLDKPDRDLTICSVSLPIAAAAQFAAPVLLPVAAGLFLYTTIPSFVGAWRVVTKERRLGVDVLDSIVVLACLATLQVLPGAILAWCLSFGRFLVQRTEDRSKKLLLGAFGKQPRYCWLFHDGQEIQVPIDRLKKGDIVVVNTGEVVPVDGVIADGLAMVDQHALTGESTPAEKGVGDHVFAATIMVAGKMYVSVEKSGNDTATAKIAEILQDTAGYKLASQHKGEQLADKAVIPTLALGAVALGAIGMQGAAAVLNSDMGTGIRMAAPLAMLSTLALCAQRGILVKDGRALDLFCEVDTVLFDKTGTLTRERPEVGRIYTSNGHSPQRILAYAAAAERKFHHPIALAILQRAEDDGLTLPETDNSKYAVGYGITVDVEGHKVRVGSRRFIEMEGVALTPEVEGALEECHLEGNSLVMVAVDDVLGGALELQAAVRPEVPEIIKGLRARGIKHLAIISGDHEAPTKRLAQQLGMDRYFAQVLPADKASYVEKLQSEGKKVCFVGDGVNDAIALKKANVSISLRGATSIATDTAHVVFMEQGLGKLCELRDIARGLESNVRTSWGLILAPNLLCIAGVFTLGFGIAASVLTNNVAALAALGNGVQPMRKVAALEAERRRALELELKLSGFTPASHEPRSSHLASEIIEPDADVEDEAAPVESQEALEGERIAA